MASFSLSRRALLRGAGAAIALPVLDAMLDGRGLLRGTAHAQTAPLPRRLVTFYFANGTTMSQWTPAASGSGYALTPCLMPLAPVRADVNVITGLENTGPRHGGVSGCGHRTGSSTVFTGMPPASDSSVGGPSVDQAAALRLGGATRLPSLAVAVQPTWQSSDQPLSVNVSWTGVGAPVPARREPLRLFNDLFGAGGGTPAEPSRDALRRRSILDYVRGDAARLSSRLGARDRALLDQHLTSVREVERALSASAPACAAPAPPEAGLPPDEQRDRHARVMMDLFALALKCDITRFGSFQLQNTGNDWPLPWLGIDRSHHQLSHENDPAVVTRYSAWAVSQFAYFVEQLKNAPEGAGSVLDNTLVVCTSEVSDGALHNYDNMPVLLAGRGGGRVATGRHLRYPAGTPMTNLYITMLQAVGADVTTFGMDSTGPLPGLLA